MSRNKANEICPCCGSNPSFWREVSAEWVRCLQCGLVFREFFSEAIRIQTGVHSCSICSDDAKDFFKKLTDWRGKKRLLDFYPPCRGFVETAQKNNWHAVSFADEFKKSGAEDLFDIVLVRGSFSKITNPQETALKIRKYLRTGGLLVIWDYDAAFLSKKKFLFTTTHLKDSLYLWSVESLTRLFGPLSIGYITHLNSKCLGYASCAEKVVRDSFPKKSWLEWAVRA